MYRVVLRNIDRGSVTPSGIVAAGYPACRDRLVALEREFSFLHAPGCRTYLAVEPVPTAAAVELLATALLQPDSPVLNGVSS